MTYDVAIYTTLPLEQKLVEELREAVAPANLTIARDEPSLEEHIASMTKEEVEF